MRSHLLCIWMLTFPILAIAQPWTYGVVLHYPMNGNCEDISGNGLDGIVSATLSTDRFGNANSCYSFNGSTEFIDLPNSSLLRPNFPFTVAYWVYLDAWSGGHVASDYVDDIYSGFWVACNTDGTINQNYAQNGAIGSSNRRTLRSNMSLQTGQWYHITAVYKGLNDMKLYIDCELAASTYTGSGSALVYSGASGNLARKDTQGNGAADYLDGKLDELIIWDREVTLEEVTQLCDYSTTVDDVGTAHLGTAPHITSAIASRGHLSVSILGQGAFALQLLDPTGKLITTQRFGASTTERSADLKLPASAGVYILVLERDGSICDRYKFVSTDN
ncbi:MAG: LamG domain-containing protein [Flavobacteriales bacterium]|nr:LamG domain-containing protein [Flavobacteriales bacterium]MCB9166083.1 LamG domain-containing protein [Flavobacteriales bacterium]